MAEPAYEYTIDLVVVECGSCHMSFGMPQSFHQQCRREGASFRCPNPKCSWPSQSYTAEGETKRLKDQLEATERSLRWAENEATINSRRAAAYKGQVTKIKRRVGKGVCPACNRTFKDLAAHMGTNHPEFCDDNND